MIRYNWKNQLTCWLNFHSFQPLYIPLHISQNIYPLPLSLKQEETSEPTILPGCSCRFVSSNHQSSAQQLHLCSVDLEEVGGLHQWWWHAWRRTGTQPRDNNPPKTQRQSNVSCFKKITSRRKFLKCQPSTSATYVETLLIEIICASTIKKRLYISENLTAPKVLVF